MQWIGKAHHLKVFEIFENSKANPHKLTGKQHLEIAFSFSEFKPIASIETE